MAGAADAFVVLMLAWLFPPAAVAIVAGCGADLCLNILLTLLAYLPGCIHAFWLVLRRAEANERYGTGNWTYKGMGEYDGPRDPNQVPPPIAVYVGGPGQAPPPAAPQPAQPAPQALGQYPAAKAPPSPTTQAPVTDQKRDGYDAGSAPPAQGSAGEKSGGNLPPAPPYQEHDGASQQVPTDQKAVQVVPHAPADQKQVESPAQTTAAPGGT